MRIRTVLLVFALLTATALAAESDDALLQIENPQSIYSLDRSWRFQMADQAHFALATLDDSQWPLMRGGALWLRQGYDYDGVAWMRLHVRISAQLRQQDLALAIPYFYAANEVYFNGVRISAQGRIGPQGQLERPDVRARLLYIPASLVQADGDNVLALRVRSFHFLGGALTQNFFLSAADAGVDHHQRLSAWHAALAVLFVFVGLSHILTGSLRRHDRHYLHFGFFSLTAAALHAGQQSIGYWLVDSFYFNLILLNGGILFFPYFLTLFFRRFFDTRIRLFEYLLMALLVGTCSLFVLTLFIPDPLYDIYARYGVSTVLAVVLASLVYSAFLTVRAMRMRLTGARILSAGFLVFGLAAINEMTSYMNVTQTPRVLDEAFLVFVVTMQTAVALRFRQVNRQLEGATAELHARADALDRANRELEVSERRYRTLIDSSSDPIFSLDSAGRIQSVNPCIRDRLGYLSQSLIGHDFFELIYESTDASLEHLSQRVVRDEFERVRSRGGSVQFRTIFRTRLLEPHEMELRFESIEGDAPGPVISARLSSVEGDELARLCLAEAQRYVFGNYLRLAETISNRLAGGVARYCDADEAFGVKLSLREMIVNAIEHGNLEISYNEKTEAQQEGRYIEFVQERQR